MKKDALFALLVSSTIWLGGCSLIRVAGPPCVGNSCPTGAGGQLPGVGNASNATNAPAQSQPNTQPNNAQAKNTDAPPQHRSLANRLHLTHGQ
jgi:hypothetical protein